MLLKVDIKVRNASYYTVTNAGIDWENSFNVISSH
jgi:hypothetical protein